MKTLFASIAATLAATQAFAFDGVDRCLSLTYAMDNPNECNPVGVPEISALEGTAAIAALAAIVLIAWERRRRAA